MIMKCGRSGTHRGYTIVVLAAALLLLITRCAWGTREVESAGTPFCLSDSQGPSFSLGWMPGFEDLVPNTEPVNLTLRLVVGVTDPDGVDSVIGSYKNSSQTEWTNVTMHEDPRYSQPDVYDADVNYTTPAGGFLYIWQYLFYANDSLGNWNKSDMRNVSVSRQIGLDGFNMTAYGVGSAILGIGIAAAALWYVRRKK